MHFFFQAEDGIRDFCLSRGLGDVYKRQDYSGEASAFQVEDPDDDAPLLPEIPSLSPGLSIPGMGLW